MTATWEPKARKYFEQFSVENCEAWFRQGLSDWIGRSSRALDTLQPFYPVHHLFSAFEHPEEQLAELFFGLKTEGQRRIFISGLARAFSGCGSSQNEWSLFDSLQYVAALVKRPEPTRAMVERLCSSDFLSGANRKLSQHLYAKAFLVISDISFGPDFEMLIARLLESDYFLPEYAPAVLRALLNHNSTKLFDHLELLRDWLADNAQQHTATADLQNALERMKPHQAIEALTSPSYIVVMSDERIAKWVANVIVATSSQLDPLYDEGKPSRAQASATTRFQDLPFTTRLSWHQLQSARRAANAPTTFSSAPAQGSVSEARDRLLTIEQSVVATRIELRNST